MISGVVVVKAGDTGAKLVLVAGRVCSVEDSVKAGGKGTSEGELTVTALMGSVVRDTKLSDFDSVTVFSWCEALWFLAPAV